MAIDVGFAALGRLARSRGVVLAGAALIVASALGAPTQALAGCGGTSVPTGAHAPSSGAGGTHAGATAPHLSSSSGSSCSATASASPPPLAGVHEGAHEPGEAPRHIVVAGAHPLTPGSPNSQHSRVHPNGSQIKP